MSLFQRSFCCSASAASWRVAILVLLFFFVAAAVILSPISSMEYMPGVQDFVNHLAAISQAKLALVEGQFPLRVMPLEVSGWRYPFFQFYSSSSYLFAGLIYRWIVPTSVFAAYKITVWCALVVGGVYMYRLADYLVRSKPVALLSGAAYLWSPYVILLVNHMGAFNETLAIGILPVVLYYTAQCFCGSSRLKSALQASFFWYLLITVHSVTFVSASVAVFLLMMLVVLQDLRRIRSFIFVSLVYGFGCLLAMWSLAPSILLVKFLKIQNTFTLMAERVLQPSLSNLLSPASNFSGQQFGDGHVSIGSLIHPALGLPFVFAAGVCIYIFCSRLKLNRERHDYWVLPVLVMFCLMVFLIWSPINVWEYLSGSFTVLQYPWRLLSQVIWLGALLFAWVLCWLFPSKLSAAHVVVGLVLLAAMGSVWLPVMEQDYGLIRNLPQPLMLAPKQDVYSMQVSRYPSAEIIKTNGAVLDLKQVQQACAQRKQDTVCQLDVPANVNLLVLPVLFYPHMLQVSVNGKSVPYQPVLRKERLLTVVAPDVGQFNTVVVRFIGLAWANKVSCCAWALWVFGFLYLMFVRRRDFFG